jgi:membrane protease YdiL (CAAX protease family)
MKPQCSQPSLVGSGVVLEPASLLSGPGLHRHRPAWLAVETLTVTAGTLVAAHILNVQHSPDMRWFLIPSLLVVAALVPTWIAGRAFPPIGLKAERRRHAFRAACGVCVVVLPAVFLGLWVATRRQIPIPLRPAIAEKGDWLSWMLYQFLYVAVAEEVFFRGYVQANVTRLLAARQKVSPATTQAIAILVSAACFALAHVIVQGRMLSLLTFFPGLLLAWLFVRTRTLLAPILFHGLANVTYGLMVLSLA